MKRVFRIGGLCALVLWCSPPLLAQVTVIGTGAGNYPTISAAVSAAGNNATVQVDATAGPFTQENLIVFANNLTITGVNGTAVISATTDWVVASGGCRMENLRFDFQGTSKTPVRFLPDANDITVRNCTFIDPGHGDTPAARGGNPDASDNVSVSVLVMSRSNVLFEDCTFTHTTAQTNSAVNDGSLRFFPSGTGANAQNCTIRRCVFTAPDVCILIDSAWDGMTIEQCTFTVPNRNVTGLYRAGIWVESQVMEENPANVTRNLVIRDCNFPFIEDTCIAFWNAIIDNVVIDNCDMGAAGDQAVHTENTGGNGLVITNCIIDNKAPGESVNTDPIWFNVNTIGTTVPVSGVVISNNEFREWGNTAINFHGGYRNVRVEGNTFGTGTLQPLYYGVYQVHSNQSIVVRNNTFLKHNGYSVILRGSNCLVSNNLMIQEGSNGRGVYISAGTPPDEAYVQPHDNVIAYNVMVNLTADGVYEAAVAANLVHRNDRIFNNTIVYCQGNGMILSGLGYQVFNNIIVACGTTGTEAGINLRAGASMAVEDFNLLVANSNNFLGWSTPGAHDLIGVNPQFTDLGAIETALAFNQPITPQLVNSSLTLAPVSPARDVGTDPSGPLEHTDYSTDLGAFSDVQIDTSVPANRWAVYR